MNDCFISFWTGALIGVIVGIFLSAVFIALSNKIEGDNGK